MQKITSHLWFDKEAMEAASFYTSVFKDSRVKNTTTLRNTPSGSVDIATIELSGQGFTLISAGPLFKFNPSVSFLIACATKNEVDAFWEKLSKDGMVLMELCEYPFCQRYGWIQDRYGLSWQVMFMGERKYEHEKREEGVYRSERSYGQFRRQIPLPQGVKTETATANFKNGVLEITMEAPQFSKSRRRIQIQGEETQKVA